MSSRHRPQPRRLRRARRPSATSRRWPACRSAPSARRSTANGRLRQETARHGPRRRAASSASGPNDLAQALHRGKSLTVGMISNDSFGRFTMPIMEGARGAPRRPGHRRSSCATPPTIRSASGGISSSCSASASTAWSSPPAAPTAARRSACRDSACRRSTSTRSPTTRLALPRARRRAGRAPRRRALVRLGRKRIAHVTGPERFEAVRAPPRRLSRRRSPQPALPSSRRLPQRHPGPRTGGARPSPQLFADPARPPDAVFCGNDLIARGVLDALRDRGIAVPARGRGRRLRQLGRDGDGARPPLTSVDMNLNALGREAGARLIAHDRRRGIQRRRPPALHARRPPILRRRAQRRLTPNSRSRNAQLPAGRVHRRPDRGRFLARAAGYRARAAPSRASTRSSAR